MDCGSKKKKGSCTKCIEVVDGEQRGRHCEDDRPVFSPFYGTVWWGWCRVVAGGWREYLERYEEGLASSIDQDSGNIGEIGAPNFSIDQATLCRHCSPCRGFRQHGWDVGDLRALHWDKQFKLPSPGGGEVSRRL